MRANGSMDSRVGGGGGGGGGLKFMAPLILWGCLIYVASGALDTNERKPMF